MIKPYPNKDARYAFHCGGNHNCYARRHGVSWEFLSQNIGGEKEMVGDIDGFIEKNGKFLFLEWKNNDTQPLGQYIAYAKLSQLPGCHVIYVIGNMEWDENGQFQIPVVRGTRDIYKGKCGEFRPTDNIGFIRRIAKWYDWAISSDT